MFAVLSFSWFCIAFVANVLHVLCLLVILSHHVLLFPMFLLFSFLISVSVSVFFVVTFPLCIISSLCLHILVLFCPSPSSPPAWVLQVLTRCLLLLGYHPLLFTCSLSTLISLFFQVFYVYFEVSLPVRTYIMFCSNLWFSITVFISFVTALFC